MKIKLSGAKNQKHNRSDRTRRILDKSTLYGINRNCKWMSEITTLEDMLTKITKREHTENSQQ